MNRSSITTIVLTGVLLSPAMGQFRPPMPPPPPKQAIPDPFGPFGPPGFEMRLDNSHKPLPGEENVPDVRDFLSGLKKPKTKDFDPKTLQDLLEKMGKNKQDPKQLEDMLKNNPQFQDPKFLEQLKKLIDSPDFAKNLQNQLGQDGPAPKIDNPNDIKQKLDDVLNKAKDPNLKLDPPNVTPPTTNPGQNPLNPNDPANNEWVKWFEKQFGDSQASKDLVKDLTEAMGKTDTKALFDEFPDLKSKEWKEFGEWGKANFGTIKPGDLPDFKLGGSSGGSSGGSGGSFGGGSGGSFGGSSGGGGGGGFSLDGSAATAIGVVVGVLGTLVLAFFLFRRWKFEQKQKAALAALGKQGIDLSSIRTREELVAAFNAVTLDTIGDDARNWNHRVIADQFSEVQPANTEPANELADLYEKARYAPEDEDLTPNEFANARRDLHTLAGANA